MVHTSNVAVYTIYFMEENLKSAGLDRSCIDSQLQKQNIQDCSEVFYAGMDKSKNLYVSKKLRIIKKNKASME